MLHKISRKVIVFKGMFLCGIKMIKCENGIDFKMCNRVCFIYVVYSK